MACQRPTIVYGVWYSAAAAGRQLFLLRVQEAGEMPKVGRDWHGRLQIPIHAGDQRRRIRGRVGQRCGLILFRLRCRGSK